MSKNKQYQIWGFAESGYFKDLGKITEKTQENALATARKNFGIVRSVEER